MSSDLLSQIRSEVSELDPDAQRRVLEYVRLLRNSGKSKPLGEGMSLETLRKYAGTISPEDAKLMLEAIEEGCGQVDHDEW